ncbi:hypothetical protein DWX10_24355 [Clostridium sp. AF18-27]|nr:hypothetical protein DWX10_24355 [Clostridium sp. AF18-27]
MGGRDGKRECTDHAGYRRVETEIYIRVWNHMGRLQKKINSLSKQKPCFLYFWKKIGKLSRIPPAYLEE